MLSKRIHVCAPPIEGLLTVSSAPKPASPTANKVHINICLGLLCLHDCTRNMLIAEKVHVAAYALISIASNCAYVAMVPHLEFYSQVHA